MNDMTLTDMGPFLQRHDRRARGVFLAMTVTSLLVSAVGFAHGVLDHGSPAAIPARLWFPILFFPLPIIWLWLTHVRMARRRPTQPDGSLPGNTDDARNGARVANAGLVFVAGTSVVCIASQVGMLSILNANPIPDGILLWRIIIVAIGALMAYFGNAYPRMPTPRAPEQKPATQRQFNRVYGWVLVIHGLLFVIAALLLPNATFAAGTGVLCLSTLLFAIALGVIHRRATKFPSPTD
jgi:hypothetical protein